MRIDIVSIFPDYLAPLRLSLPGKAIDRGILELGVHDLRSWTRDVHRSVDDTPYGGGPGMVMRPDVWGECLDDVCPDDALLVVPTPAGVPFTQATAEEFSTESHLVFACGRYEGIDQRVFDDAARRVRVREVSIGDFVLIGGEVAVMAMIEATVRLIPGVLGNNESHEQDSFSDGILEGPAYTRPQQWRGLSVPPVLLSGDHARIAAWRHEQGLARTEALRPDLLAGPTVSAGPDHTADGGDGSTVTRR
ncbi:tRNA (guanosine(37)-N1)-methyltransferase TrmD [Gordonia jinhuaensis]|uniref:tRNA (guanine-N(1)-)-methyltransferase n=1 Tax=Gordonia jinhuaensis TaxID=1517702 RepID=A0A916T4G9_9ACTN|nr:tRNA (guanosine(37)-N1)-methyltransferase TrmD [Gordonia jinhuaensis]GGB30306.1 tRNA (guanine-N(1)-)-methyltransferase [Gordonia jinhuaensis]